MPELGRGEFTLHSHARPPLTAGPYRARLTHTVTQGGPIAIHGTNAPWSIGRSVSNGCIRVPNETLRKLFGATVGGEPVIIHP